MTQRVRRMSPAPERMRMPPPPPTVFVLPSMMQSVRLGAHCVMRTPPATDFSTRQWTSVEPAGDLEDIVALGANLDARFDLQVADQDVAGQDVGGLGQCPGLVGNDAADTGGSVQPGTGRQGQQGEGAEGAFHGREGVTEVVAGFPAGPAGVRSDRPG